MNNPTESEVKEFWEWCGHYKECGYCKGTGRIYSSSEAYSQCRACEGKGCFTPGYIDLNNLFRYAVPKLKGYDVYLSLHHEEPDTFMCAIHHISEVGFIPKACRNEDPALALFWAIWKIIKGV